VERRSKHDERMDGHGGMSMDSLRGWVMERWKRIDSGMCEDRMRNCGMRSWEKTAALVQSLPTWPKLLIWHAVAEIPVSGPSAATRYLQSHRA
jgi:hypothetical protein